MPKCTLSILACLLARQLNTFQKFGKNRLAPRILLMGHAKHPDDEGQVDPVRESHFTIAGSSVRRRGAMHISSQR